MRLLLQQRCGSHDPTVHAVPAERCLLVDEGLLQRMRMFRRAEPGDGGDAGSLRGFGGRETGPYGSAVEMHSASATLTKTTAKVWVGQSYFIAQCIKQRHCQIIYFDPVRASIYIKNEHFRHRRPPGCPHRFGLR